MGECDSPLHLAIGNRQSAIGNRQSAIGNRQSAIGNRQSILFSPHVFIPQFLRDNPYSYSLLFFLSVDRKADRDKTISATSSGRFLWFKLLYMSFNFSIVQVINFSCLLQRCKHTYAAFLRTLESVISRHYSMGSAAFGDADRGLAAAFGDAAARRANAIRPYNR